MSEAPVIHDEAPAKAQQRNVALYERDIQATERIREHFGLDSFSQAVRRAIRDTAATVDLARSVKDDQAA